MRYDTVKQPQPQKMIMSQKWIYWLTRFGPFSSIHFRDLTSVTPTSQKAAIQIAGERIMDLSHFLVAHTED